MPKVEVKLKAEKQDVLMTDKVIIQAAYATIETVVPEWVCDFVVLWHKSAVIVHHVCAVH